MFAQERKSLCLNEQHKNAIFLSLSFFRYTNEKYDGGLNMKYDIIGDIHGCFQEFQNLTEKLGYNWSSGLPVHPDQRKLAFVGDITGEKHADGSPVRRDWAQEYKGQAWIVYGHTPVKEPRFVNQTVNIDTGAVFGGKLTGLRYPEMETISVPSSLPFVAEKFRPIS